MIFQIMKSGTYETVNFNYIWDLLRTKGPAIWNHTILVARADHASGPGTDCWADNEFARKAMRVVKND